MSSHVRSIRAQGRYTCVTGNAGNCGKASAPWRARVMREVTGDQFSLCGGAISTRLKTMAASLYIVVEGEDPGYDIFVNGQALARNEDALERLAERLHVTPLLEFFSADENSMSLLLEQGVANPDWAQHLPQPQWYDAPDGLQTVCALIDFLADDPAALGSDTELVLGELREYERVLRKTAHRQLHWHVAVSWR
jgi:hypothetical protein